jgi:hypothetical protein
MTVIIKEIQVKMTVEKPDKQRQEFSEEVLWKLKRSILNEIKASRQRHENNGKER